MYGFCYIQRINALIGFDKTVAERLFLRQEHSLKFLGVYVIERYQSRRTNCVFNIVR